MTRYFVQFILFTLTLVACPAKVIIANTATTFWSFIFSAVPINHPGTFMQSSEYSRNLLTSRLNMVL
jgi:hypothetical protein